MGTTIGDVCPEKRFVIDTDSLLPFWLHFFDWHTHYGQDIDDSNDIARLYS